MSVYLNRNILKRLTREKMMSENMIRKNEERENDKWESHWSFLYYYYLKKDFFEKNSKTLKTIFCYSLNFLFSLAVFLKIVLENNVKHP